MNNNEVTPIEPENNRTAAAAVQLLFESTKNLLLRIQLIDQFHNKKEVMPIG